MHCPAAAVQIVGNMFSGKSSDLIRQIKRYQISKRRCLLLKYDRDTRYSVVSSVGCVCVVWF